MTRDEYIEVCKTCDRQIQEYLMKLTYLKAEGMQESWIKGLSRCIYLTSQEVGVTFNYNGIFRTIFDSGKVKFLWYRMPKEYDRFKPSKVNFCRAAANYYGLRSELIDCQASKGRRLSIKELSRCIRTINMYSSTYQDKNHKKIQ